MGFHEAAGLYLDKLTEEGGKDIKAKRSRLSIHLTPFFGNKPIDQHVLEYDQDFWDGHTEEQPYFG